MTSLRKAAAQAAREGRGSAAGMRKSTAIKREIIVRSAAKLFLERGYDSVSINEIIAVVGGSKETIYSNFGNKAKLFEAVVQQLCSDVTINIDSSFRYLANCLVSVSTAPLEATAMTVTTIGSAAGRGSAQRSTTDYAGELGNLTEKHGVFVTS